MLLLFLACAFPEPGPVQWWATELDGDLVAREAVRDGKTTRETCVIIEAEHQCWESLADTPSERREGRMATRPVSARPDFPSPYVDLTERVRVVSSPADRKDPVYATLRVRDLPATHIPPMQTVSGARVEVRVPLRLELPAQLRSLEVRAPGESCVERSRALAERLDARVAQGLVYVPEPPSWLPHAWVVVDVEGVGPVPADPTTGEWPADALRIELPAQWTPWEARPAVEILEVR